MDPRTGTSLAPATTRAVCRTRSTPESGTAPRWAGTSGATASRASDEVEGAEHPAAITLDWSAGCWSISTLRRVTGSTATVPSTPPRTLYATIFGASKGSATTSLEVTHPVTNGVSDGEVDDGERHDDPDGPEQRNP